jgi:hypothetical protein
MTAWSAQLIAAIAARDDLHIAPFREDGVTIGTPTWIWSVVVDDRLFARAYNGPASRWYQSAMTQRAGEITVLGRPISVAFTPADPAMEEGIDDAYRTKYAGDFYLASMISARAKAAAVEITPRE